MSRKINVINKMAERGTPTQGLHDRLGIDFQKPFRTVKFMGKFTVNQMRKEAEAAGYNTSNSIILLIYKRNTDTCWRKDLYVTRITATGFDIDPLDGCASGIDKMYRKGDFEEYRKAGTLYGYLFMQKKEYLCPIKPHNRWDSAPKYTAKDRYKFVDFYYSQDITLMRTNNNGEKFRYHVYAGINAGNLGQYLDKSGYLVGYAREELARRVDAYKKENAKKAYLEQDYTAKIAALADLIAAKKEMLVQEFIKVTTADQIDQLRDKLGWNGFYSIMRDYEYMVNTNNKREYSSIESFENAYNGIMRQIASI